MKIEKVYSQILLKRFERVLKKKEWKKYRVISDQQIISFGLQYDQIGSLRCFFAVSVEKEHCVLYLVRESDIPEIHRNKIAEYLSYANYGLVLGNFEIDLHDGEIRYKMSLPAGKAAGFLFSAIPSCRELLHIVDVSVATVIRYSKGIDAMLNDSSLMPEDACNQVENRRVPSVAALLPQVSRLSEEDKKILQEHLKNEEKK